MTTPLPRIFLKPGGDKRVGHGHPWAYSNEVRMDAEAKALAAGQLVELARVDGKALGVGTFNARSLISFRMLDRGSAAIDQGWIERRLAAALALRERLFDTPHYRLVHAEADGLPGLIVDRFGDVVVVQAGTAGMETLTDAIVGAIDAVLSPRAIVLKNEGGFRALEGLETYTRIAKGTLDGAVPTAENGLTYFADPLEGQKTGWFFDQRDNHAFVRRLAAGKHTLDLYSYGGGFAVAAAAGGALSVRVVDRSQGALALAEKAGQANGLADRLTFAEADAFAELERLGDSGERFGLVVCDPPAFVKSKKDLQAGLKGYRKLARMAARLVEPGGFLCIASCSHNVEPAAFARELAIGIERAGRTGRILREAGAAPDHPVHPLLPETGYLKFVALQLD